MPQWTQATYSENLVNFGRMVLGIFSWTDTHTDRYTRYITHTQNHTQTYSSHDFAWVGVIIPVTFPLANSDTTVEGSLNKKCSSSDVMFYVCAARSVLVTWPDSRSLSWQCMTISSTSLQMSGTSSTGQQVLHTCLPAASWWLGRSGNIVLRMNKVTLRWARLVLGWVTVWADIPPRYVTKPARSTQPCITWRLIVANCYTPFTLRHHLTVYYCFVFTPSNIRSRWTAICSCLWYRYYYTCIFTCHLTNT